MKLGKTFKCLRNFCYITCLVLFSVWLFNAVKNYLSLPTTTHAFVKYGDDNLKNATFPAVTFCRLPIRSGPESKLWNSITPCVNNSVLSRPFFLNYLEVCLESKTNLSVAELVENVSYNKREALLDIRTFPYGSSQLKDGNEFEEYFDQISTSTYHYNYGHCLTVNISSLSENNGMFPMEYESQKFTLMIKFFTPEKVPSKINRFFFLHDEPDINLFGNDVAQSTFYGGQYFVNTSAIYLKHFISSL